MLRIAFVGLGWWGAELARAAATLPDRLRICGGTSAQPDQVARFARDFAANGYADMRAVLADADIDAVILSTPHSLHADQIVAAAWAGKHVFCEKPLALSPVDCVRAIRACDAAGRVLAVGHNRRFLPGAREMKRLTETGALGHLTHVQAQFSSPSALAYTPGMWRAQRAEAPGGPMSSMGIHMIDIMQWLLGPVTRVCCLGRRLAAPVDIEDTTSALFAFDSGATAALSSLFTSPPTASLSLHGTDANAVATRDFGALEVQRTDGADTIPLPACDSLAAELAAFADACAGREPFPVDPVAAARNVAVLHAIGQSIAQDAAWTDVATIDR